MSILQKLWQDKRWIASLLTLLSTIMLMSGAGNRPTATQAQHYTPLVSLPQAALVSHLPPPVTTVFPAVDPDYLYEQLNYMTSHFWRRESGYDTNLPPGVNGSGEFTAYWAQEMLKNLQGFDAQETVLPFNGNGWKMRPAKIPGQNIEVTIPGASHPDQVIIIGSHYDGMSDSSQSAYDDTSGCAAELAAARALAQYWSANHIYPALTIRFIIFDAEEQGQIGSYAYVNSTVNGDLANIVAMINEEQMGINYPLRFLGKDANGPLALDIMPTTGTTPARARLFNLVQKMVAPVFQEMQTLGYTSLAYHGQNGQDVNEPIFTQDQARYLPIVPMKIGAPSSDDVPFGYANIPNLTIGDYTWDTDTPTTDPNLPQQYVFPNDTPWDTLQLMNGYASGSTGPTPALKLALTLPAMLTDWLLANPDLGGLVPASSLPAGPISALSDIGSAQPGQPLVLDAQAAFDPRLARNLLRYHWDFGDDQQADGPEVQHTYSTAGTYTLTLTVSDRFGISSVSKLVQVTSSPSQYANGSVQYATPYGSLDNITYEPPPISGDINPSVSTDPPPTD